MSPPVTLSGEFGHLPSGVTLFIFKQRGAPPSTLLGRILLGERLGAPCKLSGLPLGLRAASRLWEVRLA